MSKSVETLYRRIEQFERDAMKRDADIENRLRALESCPAFRLTGDKEKLKTLIEQILHGFERIGWDRTFDQWYRCVQEALQDCMEKTT